jgi:diguanylate cyclase (GGDEF)-like protein
MLRFNSLRTRIVLFLVALLGIVQVTAFTLVNRANYRAARVKLEERLAVGEKVFAHELQQNAENFSQAAGVVAADFAFREAVASGDIATLVSALRNQGDRIKAAAMLYVDLDGNVIADTLKSGAASRPFEFQSLIHGSADGQSASIAMLEGRAYQLVTVPVRAPLIIGWVVVCYPIDQVLASDLRALTGMDVSFALRQGNAWRTLASTLSSPTAVDLGARLASIDSPTHGTMELQLSGGQNEVRMLPLGAGPAGPLIAVLQLPLADALTDFRTLQTTLIALGCFSLLLSLAGSVLIALGVTRPIDRLLAAVRRIQRGDYSDPVRLPRRDEIGALADGLEHMRAGIAEREHHILRLAYEDTLTQLPNRAKFTERLQHGVAAAREGRTLLGVLMMDLDRFKHVNDSLGHAVGDHLVREVGARLRELVRQADCIARLGGDEFAIVMPARERAEVLAAAEAVVGGLERPFYFEGQPLDVGASIGIALFPDHGLSADDLLRHADIAMYIAKRARTGVTVYESDYDSSSQQHLSLLGELRSAVEHGQLRLYYQPKVDLSKGSVTGAEALLRWAHPTRGLVPPDQFIPFAEQTGYIKVLTHWVLQEAVRQCGDWRSSGLDVQISVNLSARDLMHRDLPDHVAVLLREHDVPPQALCLEITESGFMEDPTRAQKVLDRLADVGVRLSVDDYGTGYSSLSYLMRLPVDELKIDRSFVARISESSDLATIVRSTIELGHGLGLEVVAEGIEDSQGFALLRSLGCDCAQGYFMSPPLPADAFRNWLDSNVLRRRLAALMPEPAAEQAAERERVA